MGEGHENAMFVMFDLSTTKQLHWGEADSGPFYQSSQAIVAGKGRLSGPACGSPNESPHGLGTRDRYHL